MLQKLAFKITSCQAGFTLIEMIVVVGVIAILSAVILPNVVRHVGSGEKGAKNVELDNVQKAFELLMAENQVIAVTPNDLSTSSTATASWNALPDVGGSPLPLAGYLVDTSTVYYYCFNGGGIVLEQFDTPSSCTLP